MIVIGTMIGYHVVPEQTAPDQARLQYEDRATDALENLCEEFTDASGTADHRLVFTHDREQTVDRVADEVGAEAVPVPGMTGDVDRLLVPLSGEVDFDRICSFVIDLVGDRAIGVTLFQAVSDDDTTATGRPDEAAERLRETGIEAETTVGVGGPFDALIDAVPGHDAIVKGDRAPSLTSLVLGEESDRVAAGTVGPVLVVRSEDEVEE